MPANNESKRFTILLIGPGTDFSELCDAFKDLAGEAGAILLRTANPPITAPPQTSMVELWLAHVFARLYGTDSIQSFKGLSSLAYICNPFTASVSFWRKATETEDHKKSPQAVPALSHRQHSILQALVELSATDDKTRRRTDEVAIHAEGKGSDPAVFKQPIAELRDLGYLLTKEGRGGGLWITDAGIQRVTVHTNPKL